MVEGEPLHYLPSNLLSHMTIKENILLGFQAPLVHRKVTIGNHTPSAKSVFSWQSVPNSKPSDHAPFLRNLIITEDSEPRNFLNVFETLQLRNAKSTSSCTYDAYIPYIILLIKIFLNIQEAVTGVFLLLISLLLM